MQKLNNLFSVSVLATTTTMNPLLLEFGKSTSFNYRLPTENILYNKTILYSQSKLKVTHFDGASYGQPVNLLLLNCNYELKLI